MSDPKDQGDDKPVKKSASRYRKVEVRTWGDEKFRALSPIQPSGQALWLFLITGPHTGPIPGLFRAGRAAMSEELDWDVEDFDKAFAEVVAQGMVKADFKARVMWLPSAIKHNKPANPNVVISWVSEFGVVPECALKWEALESLKSSVHALGKAFGKAFDDAYAKAFGKASSKTMPNQEQKLEPKQERKQESTAPGKSPAVDNSQPKASAVRLSLDFEFPEALQSWCKEVRTDIQDPLPVFRKFLSIHVNGEKKPLKVWIQIFKSWFMNEDITRASSKGQSTAPGSGGACISTIWYESAAGVEAKAKEIGSPPRGPYEQFPAFTNRIKADVEFQLHWTDHQRKAA